MQGDLSSQSLAISGGDARARKRRFLIFPGKTNNHKKKEYQLCSGCPLEFRFRYFWCGPCLFVSSLGERETMGAHIKCRKINAIISLYVWYGIQIRFFLLQTQAESQKPCQRVSIAVWKVFANIRKVFAIRWILLLSAHIHTKTVWMRQKLSGQPQNCPDNPKTVQTIQKLSGQSRNHLDTLETVQTI